jgi:UPF0042 nucleotide-binding protein
MEFLVVSGLSGAGKSRAMNALEDIGFYCVDNMPPKLLPKFAELCMQSQDRLPRVAVVVDARGRRLFAGLFESLDELQQQNPEAVRLLFLESDNQVLARRYKETRRIHPLAEETGGSVQAAIDQERTLLEQVRSRADFLIDTSYLSPAQLRERIVDLFSGENVGAMPIQCLSFGFKYGYPAEADLVMDVRCLPNPFYVDELKHKTGLDAEVQEFVLRYDETKGFERRFHDLVDYMIPLYKEEGKSQLILAIGCTGGKHRSVTLAETLCKHLQEAGNPRVMVNHRDIGKV